MGTFKLFVLHNSLYAVQGRRRFANFLALSHNVISDNSIRKIFKNHIYSEMYSIIILWIYCI